MRLPTPLATCVLLLCALAAPPIAAEGGALDASASLRDNLKKLSAAGKPVELVLVNGKSYRGKLSAVGDHAVVVSEIAEREYFDALVVLEQIAAIEVRARGQ